MKISSVMSLCSAVSLVGGANILIVLPFPWYSHTQTFMPVFRELAQRGHKVTMIWPFPQKTPVPNWTDIIFNATALKQFTGNYYITL